MILLELLLDIIYEFIELCNHCGRRARKCPGEYSDDCRAYAESVLNNTAQ